MIPHPGGWTYTWSRMVPEELLMIRSRKAQPEFADVALEAIVEQAQHSKVKSCMCE